MLMPQLLSTERPWIHSCINGESHQHDFVTSSAFIAELSGQRMRTPQDLFAEFARALQFPSYFGNNWDAMDECLNDLSWLPPGAVIVTVADAADLLQFDAELKKLIQILSSTSVKWNEPRRAHQEKQRGRPFHSVFQFKTEKNCETFLHFAREAGVDESELGAIGR